MMQSNLFPKIESREELSDKVDYVACESCGRVTKLSVKWSEGIIDFQTFGFVSANCRYCGSEIFSEF